MSPRSLGTRVIYLDSRPTSPGRKHSFREPVKRGYSYYQDAYTPVYYTRTRSSDSTPPESPKYHQHQYHPYHPSSRSHSRREGEPREYTREPFYVNMERTPMVEPLERGPSQDYFQLPCGYQQYASRPRQDPRHVPAGLFRSIKSPDMHQQRDETQPRSAYPVPPGLETQRSYVSGTRSERGYGDGHLQIRISRATTASSLPTGQRFAPPERPSKPVPEHHREDEAAYVNDMVIANYLAPSPNPNQQNTSATVAVPACLSPRVSVQPDRLQHVRREARVLDFEKPLPNAPNRGYGYMFDEDPVYKAVADAVGRR